MEGLKRELTNFFLQGIINLEIEYPDVIKINYSRIEQAAITPYGS